jgi:hypothetical protein
VSVSGDKVLVVCDEARRRKLIEQRERLLAGEAKLETAAPVALPAPEMPSGANVGAVDSIVEQASPVVQPDPVFQHMVSIGRAESWKTNEPPENHVGMFRPYPEELE